MTRKATTIFDDCRDRMASRGNFAILPMANNGLAEKTILKILVL